MILTTTIDDIIYYLRLRLRSRFFNVLCDDFPFVD